MHSIIKTIYWNHSITFSGMSRKKSNKIPHFQNASAIQILYALCSNYSHILCWASIKDKISDGIFVQIRIEGNCFKVFSRKFSHQFWFRTFFHYCITHTYSCKVIRIVIYKQYTLVLHRGSSLNIIMISVYFWRKSHQKLHQSVQPDVPFFIIWQITVQGVFDDEFVYTMYIMGRIGYCVASAKWNTVPCQLCVGKSQSAKCSYNSPVFLIVEVLKRALAETIKIE